jgi:hypothetical protein
MVAEAELSNQKSNDYGAYMSIGAIAAARTRAAIDAVLAGWLGNVAFWFCHYCSK